MKIPFTFLVEIRHQPGALVKVLSAVADMDITVGGLNAISRTQDLTTWGLAVEMDPGQDAELRQRINALDVSRVIGISDKVFDRHRGGKIAVKPTVGVEDLKALGDIYTPGVARVCLAIADDPNLAKEFTNRNSTVAIVTNGTAILGLGDIGPVAGLPVMEGKSVLFSDFADLSGVPILMDSKDPDEIIRTVESIAPTFGAIQIEDISSPSCFKIERELMSRLSIPVLHDDQHGTAVVVLSALLSAERLAGFNLEDSIVGQIGLGAAGLGISRLLLKFGVSKLFGTDLSEDALKLLESAGGQRATLDEVMQRADVVISTTGVKGLIKPEMIRPGQIIFAISNPDPEIQPSVALKHGAIFAADGKNINNVLAFPGLFKGVLSAGATHFTDEMLIAAARAISQHAPQGALVPSPLDRGTHNAVALAVGAAAKRRGQRIAYST